MTLRDYFAAKADIPWDMVVALSLRNKGQNTAIKEILEYRAKLKYAEADAMLKERKTPQDPVVYGDSEREAMRRFIAGEEYSLSHNIADELTAGYGDCDANGFWQFQLPSGFAERVRDIANDYRANTE
jgi:hypothetical protein